MSGRLRTALVIEPDDACQRQLLALLSARHYRVVPVTNSDAGLDLSQRMRFDAAFCSLHAPGLNWVELSERMQSPNRRVHPAQRRLRFRTLRRFRGDGPVRPAQAHSERRSWIGA